MAHDAPPTPDDAPTAVVLLSGGIDSSTTLAVARRDGFACRALAFDYGQRHGAELHAAHRVAASMDTPLTVFPLDLRLFGGSALTDAIDVPKDRDHAAIASGIPVTYVPARNLVFLSVALAFAEPISASDLFIGVNAVDYSGYPDCRPEFIESFQQTANLATKVGVTGVDPFVIHTPIVEMSKAEIITLGAELGVDYSLTHSCYDPSPEGLACGSCDSCQIRRDGFAAAGVPDPTRYA